MSWPKPHITFVEPPKTPLRWFFLVFWGLLLIVTVSILILSWADNHFLSSFLFWFILILAPSIITGSALSIRFYLYGLAQERYEIWQQEKNRINQNWQDWAMSSTSIIDSYWLTPNQLTATNIRLDRSNLPIQIDKILAFDNDGFEYEYYIEDLFYNLVTTLNLIPDSVNVTITVSSSSEAYCYLDAIIHQVYKNCNIKKKYTISHSPTPHIQVEEFIKLIDTPQHEIQLLIINNLSSIGSAFLAGLIMIDEKCLPIDNSIINSRLLRPMITEDIAVGIKQMVEMQPALLNITQLWCANLDKEQEVEIAKKLTEQAVSLENINFLDSIAGKQTDLAYWSLLAQGNQLVKQTQQDILIATLSQEKYIFSVLASTDLG